MSNLSSNQIDHQNQDNVAATWKFLHLHRLWELSMNLASEVVGILGRTHTNFRLRREGIAGSVVIELTGIGSPQFENICKLGIMHRGPLHITKHDKVIYQPETQTVRIELKLPRDYRE